jgi:hypothetical protein
MDHVTRRTVLGGAGLALAGVASSSAQAAAMMMKVPLSGAQQVPPVQTPGSGNADLTYNPTTRMLGWNITYSGLTGPATMAHIHGPAPAGKNAGVEVWLSKQGQPATSPIKGEAVLTPEQAQQLMAGETYVNVHTAAHPGGEIRGQIVPPKA